LIQENCEKSGGQQFLPYPGAQCLDGRGKIADFTVTPSQPFASKYFVMHVNNTLDCNGVFASFNSNEGLSLSLVIVRCTADQLLHKLNSIGDVSVNVYAVGYPIVQPNRLPSVSLCCGFLANSLQQAWDGYLVFEVTVRAYYQSPRTISVPITFHRAFPVFLPAFFTIRSHCLVDTGSTGAERLPLSLFHNLVEVETYVAPSLAPAVLASECNGTVFVNHGFIGQTVTQLCDWTIRPTADPISDWFMRAERDWPALAVPNKIAWMVTGAFPTDTPSLQFRFNNIFYAATNASVNPGSERIGASNLQLSCSYSRFQSKYNSSHCQVLDQPSHQ
jgi:hypothetical protein